MRMPANPSRHWATLLIFCLSALLSAGVASAYDGNLLLSQYQHTAWLSKDGAPTGIHAIAQTDDGYLWLAAEEGLYRFDGQTFERVPTPGGKVPGKSYAYALVAQPGGALWVGFRRGDGLGLLKDGKFTRLPATMGHEVNFMAADSHGTIWAQIDYSLYRIKGMQAEVLAGTWNVPAHIDILAVDHADSVWVTTSDWRLLRLPPGANQFSQYSDHFPVAGIAVDLQGGLWGSNQYGTWNLEARRNQPGAVRHSIESKLLGTMLFDRDGALWVQRNPGLSRIADPTEALDDRINRVPPSSTLSAEQGLSSETIYSMFEDSVGNIWTGTSKGLDRFRRTALTPVKLPGRALSYAMASAGTDAVWAGNWAGPLMKVNGKQLQKYPEVGPAVKFIRHDSKGGVWAGGGNGLWHSSGGDRFKQYPVDEDFIADSLRAVEFDAAGGLWISGGGPGRLAHVVDGKWTEASPAAGFPSKGSPKCLVKDAEQRIWACFGTDPFFIVGNTARKLSSLASGLDIGTISVVQPHGSRIWLGGYTGLAVFDGKRVLNIRRSDGLSFGEVGGIAELANGDLWLHNRTAALRIPADDLKAVLAGTRGAVDVETFDELDGLYGTLSASSPLPSLVQGDDGRLWFATDAGLAWLDPARRGNTLPMPPLHIRSLIADGTTYDLAARPQLAARNKLVELTYSATALTTPSRVRFKYRLDGIESDWQDVGTRRTAYFNDLPPGDYVFRVKSTDEYGRWNDAETKLEFGVAAAWYQTAWFKSAVVALIALAVWMLHRWRAHHLLRLAEDSHQLQMQTRMAERDRIARDLHDTILQGTTGLVLNLQVAINRLGLSDADRQHVEALLAQADQATEEARTRVTGLRTGLEPSTGFAEALRGIGEHLANDAGIAFELVPAPHEWNLDEHARDQLALIVREAVGNACQHANARSIMIRLEEQPGERVIRVIDDGVGFAVDEAASAAKASGHWGLFGMEERAAEIGARLHIRSASGRGTQVVIVVPATDAKRRWWHRADRS